MTKQDLPRSRATSSDETADFYNRLMRGEEKRGILGKENRYDPLHLHQKPSVIRYFDEFLSKFITDEDTVLDFGCGPGTFAVRAAGYCKSVTGVDITEEFVTVANDMFNTLGISNAEAVHVLPDRLPFEDGTFDALLMVDVIHHLDEIGASMAEAIRVIRPGGKVIVFEPNKLNPLIWVIHYLDRNERGLLALGTPGTYRRILGRYASNIQHRYNGIVIGPQSKGFDVISGLINQPLLYPLLGWLNPKIALYGEVNGGG
jgi:ubiquinone/menaquinone biosynthesis C-methylase UbiE